MPSQVERIKALLRGTQRCDEAALLQQFGVPLGGYASAWELLADAADLDVCYECSTWVNSWELDADEDGYFVCGECA